MENEEKEEILNEFQKKILEQEEIPSEIAEGIDENFWDMLE